MLPGRFDNSPLDKNSAHPFADLFELLPVGCYDVTVAPLDAKSNPSTDCATVIAQDVEVRASNTTEVFLSVSARARSRAVSTRRSRSTRRRC
jgi:hypothetical protein